MVTICALVVAGRVTEVFGATLDIGRNGDTAVGEVAVFSSIYMRTCRRHFIVPGKFDLHVAMSTFCFHTQLEMIIRCLQMVTIYSLLLTWKKIALISI